MLDINKVYSDSNFEQPNEFSLFYNNDEEICNNCENNLIQCETCSGYFDLRTFYEQHEAKCISLYQAYKEKETVIDCKNCHCFVKLNDLQRHKDVCSFNIQNSQKKECKFCKKLINSLLLDDHQINCEKLQNELYMVKETIECSFCKEKIALYYIESHEEKCLKLKESQDKLKNQIKSMQINFPKKWGKEIHSTDKIDENLSIISLDRTGNQFKTVVRKLHSTVPNVNVTNVYRIQNKYLWEKYIRERERINQEKGTAKENWLFHGTRSNDPKSLYNVGFDISFSSDGGSYGRGVYFARQAAYSFTSYSYYKNGYGYLFLAKVITGEPFIAGNFNQKGKRSNLLPPNQFRKPPLYDEAKFIYYDSVTDIANKENKNVSQMFIIYENNKAYPYYLIEFDAKGMGGVGGLGGIMFNPLIRQPVIGAVNPGRGIFNNNNYNNIFNNNNVPAYDDDEELDDD
jgi:hypothetical protein